MGGFEGVEDVTPGIAAPSGRVSGWGGTMASSLLASLSQPRWWAIALAGFLLRGGVLLALLPIFSLPTIATITSLASPSLYAIAFGNPPPAMVVAYAVAAIGLAIWLMLAAVLGAWLDLALAEEAANDEELELQPEPLGGPLRRAIAARALAHTGTLVAAAYAVVRTVVEAYSELLAPGDQAVPLAWRIALRVPDGIIVLGSAWLVGEAVGGLAVRGVAIGQPVGRALAWGVRRLVRPSGLATLAVTTVAAAVALVPLWLASSRTWDQVRAFLVDDAPVPIIVAALLLLVVTWLLGLALLGAGLAWRSAAWTAIAYRRRSVAAGQAAPAEAVRA